MGWNVSNEWKLNKLKGIITLLEGNDGLVPGGAWTVDTSWSHVSINTCLNVVDWKNKFIVQCVQWMINKWIIETPTLFVGIEGKVPGGAQTGANSWAWCQVLNVYDKKLTNLLVLRCDQLVYLMKQS